MASRLYTNNELSRVKKDLKSNHELGSLFQFWKEQILSEILQEFSCEYGDEPITIQNVDYNRLNDLAIRITKRLGE